MISPPFDVIIYILIYKIYIINMNKKRRLLVNILRRSPTMGKIKNLQNADKNAEELAKAKKTVKVQRGLLVGASAGLVSMVFLNRKLKKAASTSDAANAAREERINNLKKNMKKFEDKLLGKKPEEEPINVDFTEVATETAEKAAEAVEDVVEEAKETVTEIVEEVEVK
jgi:hypothetical protein